MPCSRSEDFRRLSWDGGMVVGVGDDRRRNTCELGEVELFSKVWIVADVEAARAESDVHEEAGIKAGPSCGLHLPRLGHATAGATGRVYYLITMGVREPGEGIVYRNGTSYR